MLKLMLEGVDNLLDEALEAKTMKARSVFIACAQGVLTKCIESLDNKLQENNHFDEDDLPDVPVKVKKRPILNSPQYEIRVDAKKLVQIVGADGNEAPHDLPMEIDGVVTTYGEAIGKSFTSGRFL